MNNKFNILIDNGHGNDTAGKCSPDKKIMEWQYTRELVAAINDRLSSNSNYNVILITPEDNDIPLSERVKRINKYCKQYGPENCIMISIHLNAATNGSWSTASGWECYTTKGQNNSDKLADSLYKAAETVLEQAIIRTDYSDGDPDKEAGFYILKGANCPAVLTESFFMDGVEDYKLLLSPEGFNKIVNIHVLGISNYYYDQYNKYRKYYYIPSKGNYN